MTDYGKENRRALIESTKREELVLGTTMVLLSLLGLIYALAWFSV